MENEDGKFVTDIAPKWCDDSGDIIKYDDDGKDREVTDALEALERILKENLRSLVLNQRTLLCMQE